MAHEGPWHLADRHGGFWWSIMEGTLVVKAELEVEVAQLPVPATRMSNHPGQIIAPVHDRNLRESALFQTLSFHMSGGRFILTQARGA